MDTNYYANNDYWFDDTSDGPVTAEVRIDGKAMDVRDGAWVIVAPPKFAPDQQMPTTLYDTAMETWEKKQNGGKPATGKVSFKRRHLPDPGASRRHHLAQSHRLPTSRRQHQQRLRRGA